MANHIFSFTPVDGPPIWLTNENMDALLKEAIKVILQHQKGFGRFILDGKLCKISMAEQLFYVENPAGGSPLVMRTEASPTFEENGLVEVLVKRPTVSGD